MLVLYCRNLIKFEMFWLSKKVRMTYHLKWSSMWSKVYFRINHLTAHLSLISYSNLHPPSPNPERARIRFCTIRAAAPSCRDASYIRSRRLLPPCPPNRTSRTRTPCPLDFRLRRRPNRRPDRAYLDLINSFVRQYGWMADSRSDYS